MPSRSSSGIIGTDCRAESVVSEGIRTPQPITIELDSEDVKLELDTRAGPGGCKFMQEPPSVCRFMKDSSIQESNLCRLMREDCAGRNNVFPLGERNGSFADDRGGDGEDAEQVPARTDVAVDNGETATRTQVTGEMKSPEQPLPQLTPKDEVTICSKSPHWSPPSLELAVSNDEERLSTPPVGNGRVHSPPRLEMALKPTESGGESEMRDCHVALERVEMPTSAGMVE